MTVQLYMIRFYSFSFISSIFCRFFLPIPFHVKTVSFCGSMYWMQKIIMKPVCETACTISHFIFIYHWASRHPTPCPPHPVQRSERAKYQLDFNVNVLLSHFYNFYLQIIIYWPLLMFAFHNCFQFSVAWIWWFIRIIFLLKFMIQSMNATIWVPRKFHLERNSAIRTMK